jgi:hypothetical protein
VPHIDEHGRAVRVPQWIIELEAPVDVTALLREHEDEQTAIQQAHLATQVLEGRPEAHQDAGTGETSAAPADAGGDHPRLQQARPTLAQLLARVRAMGGDTERYSAYAALRWGHGWRINPHGRGRAWDELDRYAQDPEGYLDKIDAELGLGA